MITATQPATNDALARLMLRVAAGSHERCAVCLRWAKRNKLAAVAMYFPHDGADPVPYAVCKRCTRRLSPDEVAARAEIYLIEKRVTEE